MVIVFAIVTHAIMVNDIDNRFTDVGQGLYTFMTNNLGHGLIYSWSK